MSKKIQKLYPGWVLRIYHDSSIQKEMKCEVVCLTNDSGDLIDNVDFCNIESIHGQPNSDIEFNYNKFRHLIYDSSGKPTKTWSAQYIHAMVREFNIFFKHGSLFHSYNICMKWLYAIHLKRLFLYFIICFKQIHLIMHKKYDFDDFFLNLVLAVVSNRRSFC